MNDFRIMLEEDDPIKHVLDDGMAFEKWLKGNNIQNVREEKGWIIDN